jgi:hypothetical protein
MNYLNGLKAVGIMAFFCTMICISLAGLSGGLPHWTIVIPLGFIIGLVFYAGATYES